MVGSRHTRRLAAIVLAGVFIFAASGCYVGSSTVGSVDGDWLSPAHLALIFGPGKITGGGDTTNFSLWRAAPTAVSVHFAVTSSDSTLPTTVDAVYFIDASAPVRLVSSGTGLVPPVPSRFLWS